MIFSSLRCSLKIRQARRATRRLLMQARGAQRSMATFEAAARRGGVHFAHGGVISRLFGIAKPRSFFLALHKMALRRRRESKVNTPQHLDARKAPPACIVFLEKLLYFI